MAIWQVGTFGEVSNIKECNAKDRTKLFCAVVYCTYCTNCEVFLGSRTNIICLTLEGGTRVDGGGWGKAKEKDV